MLNAKSQEVLPLVLAYLVLSVLLQIADPNVLVIVNARAIKLALIKSAKIRALVLAESMHNVVLSVTRLCATAKWALPVIHLYNALSDRVRYSISIFIVIGPARPNS